MRTLLSGAMVYQKGRLIKRDVAFEGGRLIDCSRPLPPHFFDSVFSVVGKVLIPGLVDAHVHLREPGFSFKERIATGTLAAARGGYTAVCAMPNLNPVPDTVRHLNVQREAIARDACVRVYPYGALTMGQKGEGEPADLNALSPYVVGFSDDGRGVQSESLMRQLMTRVRELNGIVVAHCEDNALLHGGYIHDGAYCRAHGHKGICSQSEYGQIERDLRLAGETGCRYHVCHVSAKESVAAIRAAKREGVDVTCETAPHYLLLCDEDLREDGRFKMNPPLRAKDDREALIEGLNDGTIDLIATDHAPHTAEEKGRGLAGSVMGVVGLECALGVLMRGLVETGRASLETVLRTMTDAPRQRFRLPPMTFAPGETADMALLNLDQEYTVDAASFASMGHSTPFDGERAKGVCEMTIVGGKTVWQRG